MRGLIETRASLLDKREVKSCSVCDSLDALRVWSMGWNARIWLFGTGLVAGWGGVAISGKFSFSANRFVDRVRCRITALPQNISGHVVAIVCIFTVSLIAALHPTWIVHLPLRCQMQVIFGVKCPFCGMTRDFIDM
jgi:hypothetical protein